MKYFFVHEVFTLEIEIFTHEIEVFMLEIEIFTLEIEIFIVLQKIFITYIEILIVHRFFASYHDVHSHRQPTTPLPRRQRSSARLRISIRSSRIGLRVHVNTIGGGRTRQGPWIS